MNIDVYIIRQNTPESRLLSRLGFERRSLQVAEWRGRRRSKGGFGKKPVAWRISGETNVEKLCSGIERILGEKRALTREEQATLDRVKRTLAALRNRELMALAASTIADTRYPIVTAFLMRRFPLASKDEIIQMLEESLDEEYADSIDDLLHVANSVLSDRLVIWKEARTEVIRALMPDGDLKPVP